MFIFSIDDEWTEKKKNSIKGISITTHLGIRTKTF